jgi:hypothetical protein
MSKIKVPSRPSDWTWVRGSEEICEFWWKEKTWRDLGSGTYSMNRSGHFNVNRNGLLYDSRDSWNDVWVDEIQAGYNDWLIEGILFKV